MFTPSRAQTKISRFGDEEMLDDGGTIMLHETWRHITQTEVRNSKADKNADLSRFIMLLQPGIINSLIS